MYRDHEIGVIVPAYDEEGLVGEVLRGIPEYVDRVYAVDDRSTDDTWSEIRTAARTDAAGRDPQSGGSERTETDVIVAPSVHPRGVIYDTIGRVVPIRHHENRGAGGAIKTGYLVALADGVDVVATVDGDGQMDLEQLPRLLDPIVENRVDYAKGNRLGADRNRMPAWRLFGNAILTLLTRIASGYWGLTDPQNGYTAISRGALEAVDVGGLYEYYGYCNDLLVKLNVAGARVGDVTMPPIYGDEQSNIVITEYVPRVSEMLLRNFLWRLSVTYGRDRPGRRAPGVVRIVATLSLVGALASSLRHRSERKRRSVGSKVLLGVTCLALAASMRAVIDDRNDEASVVKVDG